MSEPHPERQIGIGLTVLTLLLLAATSWPVLEDLTAAGPPDPVEPAISTTPATAEGPTSEKPVVPVSLFREDFEDGARGWRVLERGSGEVSASDDKAVLAVPRSPTRRTVAALRRTFDEPVRDLTVTGRFKVAEGGCDRTASVSRGNVPIVRIFDPAGQRLISLYRANGTCGRTAGVYVEHSGGLHQTSARVSIGEWVKVTLHATSPTSGAGLLRVTLDSVEVYRTDRADHGGQPFGAVGLHDEVPYQVGVLKVDQVSAWTQAEPVPRTTCEPDGSAYS